MPTAGAKSKIGPLKPRDGARYGIPLVLAMPALIPLAHAYIAACLKGMVFTGFIQYDMPYYMANARECFDGGLRK
jgi:hypothetical protein